jgi:hypothetical protein
MLNSNAEASQSIQPSTRQDMDIVILNLPRNDRYVRPLYKTDDVSFMDAISASNLNFK